MKNRLGQIIFKIIIIEIIIFFSLVTIAKAKEGHTFNIELDPYTQEVKPGGEVTISVSVSNIDMGEDGINVLEGKINYDRAVFEEVTTASIRNFDTWSTTYNDENSSANGKFLSASLSENVKKDSKVFNITFKVRDDITEETKTQIEFESLTSNDVTDLINIGSKTTKVKVIIPRESDENTNGNQEQTSNQSRQSGLNDNSKTGQTIPYTGRSIIIVLVILAGAVILVFLAIRNRKMKDVK